MLVLVRGGWFVSEPTMLSVVRDAMRAQAATGERFFVVHIDRNWDGAMRSRLRWAQGIKARLGYHSVVIGEAGVLVDMYSARSDA